MKIRKALALFLSATLSLSVIAGCGGGGSTTSTPPAGESTAPVTESTPAETTSTFTWNGQKEVWSVLPTTMAEGLVTINDKMGEKLQADGWTYVKKDAQGDPGQQVTFIEDAIASGKVGAIMCAAMSVEMLQDVVLRAIDAGIIVVYLGAEPTEYTINACVYTAYELTGYYAIQMVKDWVAMNGKVTADSKGIPVALDVYEEIADGKYRSNAFRGEVEKSGNMYIYNENVTYGDDAQNGGYAWAENMMTANPDLRIFVCYEPDCMVGVTSYLSKYAQDNGLDLTDFCVVNCYQDSATSEEYAKAKADASSTAFKGYVTYGDEGDVEAAGGDFALASMTATGHKLAEEIMGAADGSWPFGQTYYDTINAYATWSETPLYTWKMGDENVAAEYKVL